MTPNRLQDLYWKELVQLKVDCEYIRRYRDSLNSTLTWFAVIRAVVSVSALGAWAVVKDHPLVWGGVIAAAQVADAVQRAIPLAIRAQGTSALFVTLDALLIDCQLEWENIYNGKLTENEITKRRHVMMKLRHEAETKNLPGGLHVRKKLFALAEADANAYFQNTYGTGSVK